VGGKFGAPSVSCSGDAGALVVGASALVTDNVSELPLVHAAPNKSTADRPASATRPLMFFIFRIPLYVRPRC